MVLRDFVYNGRVCSGYTKESAVQMGVPDDVISGAVLDTKWFDVKSKRDYLLLKVDWTQMPDSPLTAEQKAAWAEYRQALRDIPNVYDDPDDVVWPEKPTL